MDKIDFRSKKFGMASGRMNFPTASINDFLEFHEFNAIELPVSFFEDGNSVIHRKIRQNNFLEIQAGGLLDRELTKHIPFANEKLRLEYAEQCTEKMNDLFSCGIMTAAVECPLRSLLENTAAPARENMLEILRIIARRSYAAGQTILVPYWIPGPADVPEYPSLIGKFLRDTMMPNVKLRLDIHVHEMEPDADPRQILGYLGREVRSAVFVYDADDDIKFTEADLLPWIEVLDENGYDGPYLLCPNSVRHRMAYPEAKNYAKMISGLRNR